MSPNTDKSKQWRETNKDVIDKCKKVYNELLERRRFECWNDDKLFNEIGSSLFEKDLQDLWYFGLSYYENHKSTKVGKFFYDIVNEIRIYGTIEPLRKRKYLKAADTIRRKSNARKNYR